MLMYVYVASVGGREKEGDSETERECECLLWTYAGWSGAVCRLLEGE